MLEEHLRRWSAWLIPMVVSWCLGWSLVRACAVLAICSLLSFLYEHRARRRMVHPHPNLAFTDYPILGQIGIVGQVLRDGAPSFQLKMAQAANFQTLEVVMFGKPNEYMLMDVLDRKYMLSTNWKNFPKNLPDGSGFQENFSEIMGRGIFAVDGEEWKEQRKVASHMFSANALKQKMQQAFAEHGKQLVELIQAHHLGKEMDLQGVMAAFTFDTICNVALGVSTRSVDAALLGPKPLDFLVRFDRAQQNCGLRFFLPPEVWQTMRLLNIGTERQLREDCHMVREYVREIVRNELALRGDGLSGSNSGNLLALYVNAAQREAKPHMLEETYLIDAALNFMIAGRDTTSCLLTNLFKLMTPEVEQRMLEEFDRVVGRSTVGVTWDHVRELPYCNAVFNEVLRLYPPVAFDLRCALEDDILPSGLHVSAGDIVSLPLLAIGRDPKLFPRPNEFAPERWLSNAIKLERIDEYALPAFWAGPRLCLGRDMARLEVLSASHALLTHFTCQILPHSERKVNGPVQFYAQGLPARFTNRE